MKIPLRSTLALLVVGVAACGDDRSAERRPDVIVVLSDTLRADRLGCYGYDRPTSPVIDRFAREGTLFEDVTAQASWTLPSLVSIFQGRYLTGYRETLEDPYPSLAESFNRAGYRTLSVVANLGVGAHPSFRRGFDFWDSTPSSRPTQSTEGITRAIGELEQDLFRHLDRAEAKDAGGERPPLFLYLHTMDAHMPFEQYPRYMEELPLLVDEGRMPHAWQREVFAEHGQAPPKSDPKWRRNWWYVNAERGRYDQGVRRNDEGLGRILGRLEERGYLEDAIVVFMADHGECLWERVTPNADRTQSGQLPPDLFFYRTHGGTLNEELVFTPLVFWGRGIPAGVRVSEPVENVDVYPTLLELCDIPSPPSLHGRSLVAAMRGAAIEDRDAVYTFTYNACSIREEATGWKLILPNEDQLRFEVTPQLFYLPDDPDERNDVSADHPDVVARLTERLEAWKRDHPTEARVGERDPKVEATLRNLGYTDADIGD